MRFTGRQLFHIAILAVVAAAVVEGCSHMRLPGRPYGPWIGDFSSLWNNFFDTYNPLRTTTVEDVVWSELFVYDGNAEEYQKTPILINTTTGEVRRPAPNEDIVFTREPVPTQDHSQSFHMTRGAVASDGRRVAVVLRSLQYGRFDVSFQVPAQASFLLKDDDERITFDYDLFVSARTQHAYIIVARTPPFDGYEYDYELKPIYIGIVDLRDTAHRRQQVMFQDFPDGGGYGGVALPYSIYDDLQVGKIDVSYRDTCGGSRYFFYNETQATTAMFPRFSMHEQALVRAEKPEDLSYYKPREESISMEDEVRLENFTIVQQWVIPGRKPARRIQLDKEAIFSIASELNSENTGRPISSSSVRSSTLVASNKKNKDSTEEAVPLSSKPFATGEGGSGSAEIFDSEDGILPHQHGSGNMEVSAAASPLVYTSMSALWVSYLTATFFSS
jgi:hypothetical protein